MNEEEIDYHARRIVYEQLEDFEYSLVYEDDELEGASEDEWRAILASMTAIGQELQEMLVKND